MPKKPNDSVITIRMTPELHADLKDLAYARRVSMNSLAVALFRKGVIDHRLNHLDHADKIALSALEPPEPPLD